MKNAHAATLQTKDLPTYESTPITKNNPSHSSQAYQKHLQPTSLAFNGVSSIQSQINMQNVMPSHKLPSPKSNMKNSRGNSSLTKLNDIDSNTIQRQRKELQLMINELKERDRELNDMVHTHHQQLVLWESDRLKLANVEKQLLKYKCEYRKRHDQCKILKERLRLSESGVQSKHEELQTTQHHLQKATEKADLSSNHVDELMVKNQTLESSIEELTSRISILQAKEQQAQMSLRLKNKDITAANTRIEELTSKLKRSNNMLLEYKKEHGKSKVELEKAQSRIQANRLEIGKLRDELSEKSIPRIESPNQELTQLKEEILILQKELLVAGEREKRKDSLLELSRSKQERTEIELNHLRKLYDNLLKENRIHEAYHEQDDRLSVFTVSLNDRTPEKLDVFDISGTNATAVGLRVVDPHGQDREVPPDEKVNETTLDSFVSEDVGEMCASELKSNGVPSQGVSFENSPTERLQDKPNDSSSWENSPRETPRIDNLEETISPTARLHRLLAESRQMIKNLEKSPTFSSNTPTSDHKEDESDENSD